MNRRRASAVSAVVQWRGLIVRSELRPSARHVALTLSLHMDSNGGSCFPSLTRLAEETGWARSTVCISLDELERACFITRRRRRGRPTHYLATSPATGLPLVRRPDATSPGAGPEDVQADVHNPYARVRARGGRENARAGGARAKTKTDEFSYLSEAGQ